MRAPSGDGRAMGASLADVVVVDNMEGGGMVVVVDESMEVGNNAGVVEGVPIMGIVELEVVDSDAEAVVAVVVVDDDDEVSSPMSMADTPLHSSKACTHGSRHDAHSSDSSSNSLCFRKESVAM